MAIKSTERNKSGSTEKELETIVDNGDLKLVDSLVDAYSFKDRDSLLKFAIATLLRGNNDGGIYTIKTGEDGKKFLDPIVPSSDFVVKKEEDAG
jgi:metallophosphoesterase superfamily enzyme